MQCPVRPRDQPSLWHGHHRLRRSSRGHGSRRRVARHDDDASDCVRHHSVWRRDVVLPERGAPLADDGLGRQLRRGRAETRGSGHKATAGAPQWAQLVAMTDGTSVTVYPNVDLPGATGVAPAPANTSTTYTLSAGEYIQWQESNDMTGTIIQSNLPVSFTGGQDYACYTSASSTEAGCDSAHQQVPPDLHARQRIRARAIHDAQKRISRPNRFRIASSGSSTARRSRTTRRFRSRPRRSREVRPSISRRPRRSWSRAKTPTIRFTSDSS